jgi:pyruvate/2-oxoglutarate dehydrogenase complex dihydrolipoamide dehydrogenase (E3) component
MDYGAIATTVFTPLEYGCVGLNEQEAIAQYGADNIDVWHSAYDTLEQTVAHRTDHKGMPLPPQSYTKMITLRSKTPKKAKVLGLHVLGPHAGEVIQGFAAAIKLGATKHDIDATIGIHPTHAEEVVMLDRNKRDGKSPVKTSC